MVAPTNTSETINTSLRVIISVDVWKKFGLIASIRGVDKKNLLSESVVEFVKNHERELKKFTNERAG